MNSIDINEKIISLTKEAEARCKDAFEAVMDVYNYNSQKVLDAFIKNKVSASHLLGTTGYGYDDIGRDLLDKVFADVLGAEDALVRHSFVNGTHAISTALFGVLRPGDLLLSLTGKPYDTLSDVIFAKTGGSLTEFGIKYQQIDLLPDDKLDYSAIEAQAKGCKVAYIQRSKGYSLRHSITVDEIATLVKIVKNVNPNAIVMVDNCYGELAEKLEPTNVGADLIIGSLIKNLGGGIASTGAYIAGRSDLIELCAYRLTTVGVGKEVGCTLNQNREMYLGLFLAPSAVMNAVKTSIFATSLFDLMGYQCFPKYDDVRTDIIAAICLKNEQNLTTFCQKIQAASPIDSFASPEAWDMPGYNSKVIMAAGAFTMGSSIELSADAPLREPFAVYVQGGLTYPTGKLGIMNAAEGLLNSAE